MITPLNCRFWKTCTNFDGPAVNDLIDMIDHAMDISRASFRRHTDRRDREAVEQGLGYDLVTNGMGLHISRDYHVSYHRSKYRGQWVYFFKWSAIEHIFVPEDFDEYKEITR